MTEWRTMRSAPRRSTPFLCWAPPPNGDGPGNWAVCYLSIDATLCYDTGAIVEDESDEAFRPSHWMKLPPPPGAKP